MFENKSHSILTDLFASCILSLFSYRPFSTQACSGTCVVRVFKRNECMYCTVC